MKYKRKTGRASERDGEPGNPDQSVKVTGIRLEPDGTVTLTLGRPLGERVSYAPPEGVQDPDVIEPTAVYKPFADEWVSG